MKQMPKCLSDNIRNYNSGFFIRDYESVPCLSETHFVSVSESVGASTTVSLPHTKAAQKAAWHLTKRSRKFYETVPLFTKTVPLTTKNEVTVRLPEGDIPAKGLPSGHGLQASKWYCFFRTQARLFFVSFRRFFVEVGWQRAAAGCIEGGMPCSHEQTDSDAAGIDANGIIQRFRNPELDPESINVIQH